MSNAIRVPSEIAASVYERWPDVGTTWASGVERELSDICSRLGAAPNEVLPARYSVVVTASMRRGDVVIRVTPDPDAANQARVARLLAECGAGPRIHEVHATDLGVWTVSDRVIPGISLKQGALGSVKLDDVAAPFREIAWSKAAVDGLPTISSWLRSRLADPDLRDIAPRQSVASLAERKFAQTELAFLDADAGSESATLCHGDSHPGNLLVSADGPRVLLIDPRGMRGEVEYDIGVLSLKLSRYDRGAAKSLCKQLAARAGVDGERAAAWITVAHAARV